MKMTIVRWDSYRLPKGTLLPVSSTTSRVATAWRSCSEGRASGAMGMVRAGVLVDEELVGIETAGVQEEDAYRILRCSSVRRVQSSKVGVGWTRLAETSKSLGRVGQVHDLPCCAPDRRWCTFLVKGS